jgi:hypothetical protein
VSNAPVTAVIAFRPVLVVSNGLSQAMSPFPGGAVFVTIARLVGAELDMCKKLRGNRPITVDYLTPGTIESQRFELPRRPNR